MRDPDLNRMVQRVGLEHGEPDELSTLRGLDREQSLLHECDPERPFEPPASADERRSELRPAKTEALPPCCPGCLVLEERVRALEYALRRRTGRGYPESALLASRSQKRYPAG